MAPVLQIPACSLRAAAKNLEGAGLLPKRLYYRDPDSFYDWCKIVHALPGILKDLVCIEIDRESLCTEFRSETVHWLAYAGIKHVIVPVPDRDGRLTKATWRCIIARDDKEEEKREDSRWYQRRMKRWQKIIDSSGPDLAEARTHLHATMRLDWRENAAMLRRKARKHDRKRAGRGVKYCKPSNLRHDWAYELMVSQGGSTVMEDGSVTSADMEGESENLGGTRKEEVIELVDRVLKVTR
jgi:hypothetical protein